MPPAPPTFSMITCWPSVSESRAADDAPQHVGAAAGGERNHHGHRPGRPALRGRRARARRQYGGDQRGKQDHVFRTHGVPRSARRMALLRAALYVLARFRSPPGCRSEATKGATDVAPAGVGRRVRRGPGFIGARPGHRCVVLQRPADHRDRRLLGRRRLRHLCAAARPPHGQTHPRQSHHGGEQHAGRRQQRRRRPRLQRRAQGRHRHRRAAEQRHHGLAVRHAARQRPAAAPRRHQAHPASARPPPTTTSASRAPTRR